MPVRLSSVSPAMSTIVVYGSPYLSISCLCRCVTCVSLRSIVYGTMPVTWTMPGWHVQAIISTAMPSNQISRNMQRVTSFLVSMSVDGTMQAISTCVSNHRLASRTSLPWLMKPSILKSMSQLSIRRNIPLRFMSPTGATTCCSR